MNEPTMIDPSPSIRGGSQVCCYPLFFRSPTDQLPVWISGVEQTALAIELPPHGARAVQILQSGQSLAETAALIEREYGELIDLADLIHSLSEIGFVQQIDDQGFPPPERIGQVWLARISPVAVSWLYTRPALVISTLLLLIGLLLLPVQPTLRPHAQDLLWSPSYTLNRFIMSVLAPFLLIKHELGHLLAARARGLPAALACSNRLFFLGAVSRIAEIWKVRRIDRLLIDSAGMFNGGVTVSLRLLLLYATNPHLLPLASELRAFLRAIVLSECPGIAWQFLVFLRTGVENVHKTYGQ